MIKEIVGCFVIVLFCMTIIVIVAVFNVLAKKRKARRAYIKRLNQDKLAKRNLKRILNQMKCKWDDKTDCRQNRECDYCSEINCLRKATK